jgi:hypothetical protein
MTQALAQSKRRLVHIEWVDASGPNAPHWTQVQLFEFKGEYLCWSVGWIVAETPTHYHVAPHFGNIGEPEVEQMLGWIAIPKKMVKRMKRLTALAPRK